jgi:uncharacterized delta-60 repeat protein
MTRSARIHRHTFRPRLDALEDRQLLTAGVLDTATFNPPNGYVLTGFTQKGTSGTQGTGTAVQVQSDGKIVAAGLAFGEFALARYNPNGTLDTTFGTGGKVLTGFPKSTPGDGLAAALALQPDGKIVVAGQVFIPARPTGQDYFGVARYNANGTLDTTFGPNHNGEVTVLLGSYANGGTDVQSIALQPDGKILVGGYTSHPGGYSVCTLVRLNTAGNLDPTFGTGGVVTNDITPGFGSYVQAIGFETVVVNGTPTTRIVTDGWVNWANPPDNQSAVARYNMDGSLDTTFGTGGVVINTQVHSHELAIQPDSKIVVAGGMLTGPSNSVWEFAAVRYNVDGSLDTTFNPSGPTPGIATVGNGTTSIGVRGLALQPGDGKIIVAGVSEPTSGYQTALARFNPDGSLDTTFGPGGLVVKGLTSYDSVGGVVLQPDGKIVTVGSGSAGSGSGFLVARFLNQAPTTTTLASSANPSVSGQPVTFTAIVSTVGAGSPTGTVQFFDGSTLLGTGTLSTANGVTTAAFSTTTLAVGTHSITAVYGGDSNDMGSTSAALSQVVNTTPSIALVTSAAQPVAPMTATAPSSSPSPLLAPLVLDDPGFLTSLVGGKRRRSS